MPEFRYNDAARKLDEALDEDLKIAAPVDVEPLTEEAGLLRLARCSVFDSVEADKLAAHAGAERVLLEHTVGVKLRELEQQKTASVDSFICAAKALKDPV